MITVTLHVELIPFSEVAIIFTVPSATAVIFPFSTLAISSFDELQVIVLSVAL